MTQVVGQRIPRHDALQQVTGTSIYTNDLIRPGMLHSKAVRSAFPHAAIVEVDTSKAIHIPGVAAIITARDVPNNSYGFTHVDQEVLCTSKVRYRGDLVAAVAADSLDAAEEAASLIEVEYHPLPAVFDVLEAMKPDAPKVHGASNIAARVCITSGDIEQGWRESDVVVEETIRTQRQEHCQLEPHVALAEVDSTGFITVHSSLQRPFRIAADLSRILQVPINRIRVVNSAVGGGFGGKGELSVEAIACLLALHARKPVVMSLTREEEFRSTTVRHPDIAMYKTGVKKDGTLVARQIDIVRDTGAYVSQGQATLNKACILAAGPYRIPNVKITGHLVYTNSSIGGAMRGAGAPQVAFACETHMDTIAETLGMDPLELRLKNILEDYSTLPTGQVLEKVTLRETIQRAVEIMGWKRDGDWL